MHSGSAGEGLALAFQARGLHVFATARSLANLENLSKLPNVTPLALDVTVPSSSTYFHFGNDDITFNR